MNELTNSQTLLASLLAFIHDEQAYGNHRLYEIWERPLADKLEKGWSQGFLSLDRGSEPNTLWATLDDSESRFREGDLLFLHATGLPAYSRSFPAYSPPLRGGVGFSPFPL